MNLDLFQYCKNDSNVWILCIAQSTYPIQDSAYRYRTKKTLTQLVLAHLQVSVTFKNVFTSSDMSPQLIPSSGVYNLCPEMSTDYNYLQLFKTHKQNKFLTVKCTFPSTGTQVSTYDLLLSRYCISGNLATLPGKLTRGFPFVFITILALKILHLRILK